MSQVKPENLHIAQIPGETEPRRLDRILTALADGAGRGRSRRRSPGWELAAEPHVVWGPGGQHRHALARAVEDALAGVWVAKEKRGFTAHFTLGRVRSPRNLEALLAALRAEPEEGFGMVRVDQVALMESELNPSGSIYTVRDRFSLRSA
jgi:2'-5' RNA ligase